MSENVARKDRRRSICVLVIIVAIGLTFGRVCMHEFVGGWDDGPLIVDNPLVNPPTAEGFAKIWTQPHARMYIPAVYSVWWGLARVASVPDAQTGGTTLNPYVFHAANLLAHLTCALLVFGILRVLVRDDVAACAGALLFALHPLQTEAVAWATGMKDLLCGVFALAALWQYVCLATTDRRRAMHYALATLALVAALFAKPAAVVVPLIAFVIDVLLLKRDWRRSLRALWPWMLLIVPCLIWTSHAQPTPELIPPPLWQRPIIAIDTIGFYLVKLVWPAKLGIDYGLRPGIILHRGWWIAAAIVAATVFATRRRWLTASVAVFVLGFLPVIGLTPFVFQAWSTVADRYVYLSMLGTAIAVAFVLKTWDRPSVRWGVGVVLVLLAVRSFVQAGTWEDAERLSRHALLVNPKSPAANNSLGDVLFKHDDFPGAYRCFDLAVRKKPDFLSARDNLASTLVHLGREDEALALMKQTLAMRRALPEPIRQPIADDLLRIATVLRMQGRGDEAERYDAERRALGPAGR